MRDNQIVGYGLVVGLKGTGDSLRNSPFTEQSLQSMLDSMGINVRNASLRTRNVAGVIVTAELPPFIGKGARIDITVSSLGDATSLLGGTLVMTPLMGADGQIYAVGAGAGRGFRLLLQGDAESLTEGVPTTGRIPNGALVEKEVAGDFWELPDLVLELKNPDFTTAIRVVDAINAFAAASTAGRSRRAGLPHDRAGKARRLSAPRFIAEIGELVVEPDTPARVVIDERTGTVVIGRDVQISTVAVTHGNLTVRVTEAPGCFAAGAALARRDDASCRARSSMRRRAAASSRSSAAPICRPSSPASIRSGLSRPASSRSCRRSSRPARCRRS